MISSSIDFEKKEELPLLPSYHDDILIHIIEGKRDRVDFVIHSKKFDRIKANKKEIIEAFEHLIKSMKEETYPFHFLKD